MGGHVAPPAVLHFNTLEAWQVRKGKLNSQLVVVNFYFGFTQVKKDFLFSLSLEFTLKKSIFANVESDDSECLKVATSARTKPQDQTCSTDACDVINKDSASSAWQWLCIHVDSSYIYLCFIFSLQLLGVSTCRWISEEKKECSFQRWIMRFFSPFFSSHTCCIVEYKN